MVARSKPAENIPGRPVSTMAASSASARSIAAPIAACISRLRALTFPSSSLIVAMPSLSW